MESYIHDVRDVYKTNTTYLIVGKPGSKCIHSVIDALAHFTRLPAEIRQSNLSPRECISTFSLINI